MIRLASALAALSVVSCVATAYAAEPVCGDVNDSGGVNTSDALLVLRKGVGQNVTLACSGYESAIVGCQADLSATNADLTTCNDGLGACNDDFTQCVAQVVGCNMDLFACQSAPVCGNAIVESGEDCEAGDLNGATCATEGFAGGTLACAAGCEFDASGCYAARYNPSGATIVDFQTGLEWERKSGLDEVANLGDPHDVDNTYQWSEDNPYPDGGAFTHFLGALNGSFGFPCYAGHCDWRLPTVEELRTIVVADCQLPPCVTGPELLPSRASVYWSATTDPGFTHLVRTVPFSDGSFEVTPKLQSHFVRAVRTRTQD